MWTFHLIDFFSNWNDQLYLCARIFFYDFVDCSQLLESEHANQETIERYEERLREVNNQDENADGIKKKLHQKNIELESYPLSLMFFCVQCQRNSY